MPPWKKQGDSAQRSTRRDVAIADAPAQLYRRVGGAIAAPFYEDLAHGTQFGASSRRGADHAARM
eukprot:3810301-Alexandrium_andersonii.AAC.1